MKKFNKKFLSVINRVHNFFMDLTIVNKFFICFTIIVAMPIIFGGLYIFKSINNYMFSEFVSNNIVATEKMKNFIDGRISTCRRVAYSIVSIYEINSYVNGGLYSLEELQSLKNLTGALYVTNLVGNKIRNIRVLVNNEDSIEIPPMIMYSRRLKNPKIIKNLRNNINGEYWLFNNEEKTELNGLGISGTIVYYYIKKGFDRRHDMIVEISMDMKEFLPYVDFNGTDSKYLVTKDYIVAIDAQSKQKYGFENIEKLRDLALNNFKQSKKDTQIIDFSDDRMLSIKKNISFENGSYLLTFMDTKNVAGKINSMKFFVTMIITFSLLIFALVVRKLVQIILKRMGSVVIAMRRVEKGDMFFNLDVKGNDEIGVLARGFNNMTSKLIEYINLVVKKETETRDAEIQALLSQIDAHFFYNAVDSIRCMAEVQQKYEIADALILLAQHFRYNLDWSKKIITLKEELDHVCKYIGIMNIRYENTINLRIKCSDEISCKRIIKMLIQPLVENSVVHGLAPRYGKGNIFIGVESFENNMKIIVVDNGVGISNEKLTLLKIRGYENKLNDDGIEKHPHIAIKNILQRLDLHYGEKYQFDISSREGHYTLVSIIIPNNGGKAYENTINS